MRKLVSPEQVDLSAHRGPLWQPYVAGLALECVLSEWGPRLRYEVFAILELAVERMDVGEPGGSEQGDEGSVELTLGD
jgi:hypothetical protein